jgi:hypothetical protein
LISAAVLNLAYRNARDADIRERILLITRVRLDKNEASSVAENEFHTVLIRSSSLEGPFMFMLRTTWLISYVFVCGYFLFI